MKVLDLFSGIGGFSLGLERAGMETVAFCEIEPFCQQVLKKHWPDVPIYSDIKELTYEQYREHGNQRPDVVTGGVPCQPASHAGKQRGAEDDRWLWPEAVRILREFRPRWVVFENVYGFLTLNEGMEFDNVLASMETLDYEVQSFVIPACAVDAKHRRDRVWIVANSKQQGLEGQPGDEPGRNQPGREPQRQNGQSAAQDIQPGRNIGSTECGLGGMVDGISRWLDEPGEVPRVTTGQKDRVSRLKALGNAVVPQAVEVIGRAIMETEGYA